MLPTIAANVPGATNNSLYNGSGNPSFYEEKPENVVYYMKRESEGYPTKIKDNYIKATAEYMKDCEVLVEKIKNHEYNFGQLKDLVDYYNANCGND